MIYSSFCLCSEGVVVTNNLVKLLVLVGEVSPFAVVFETLHVLWGELHLSELLREVLGAVFVIELWLVWSSLFLLVYGIPVYAFEPGMSHDILSIVWSRSKPCLWVLVEKLGADIPSIITQEWEVKPWLIVFDISEKFLFVFAIKWWFTAKHLINDTTK